MSGTRARGEREMAGTKAVQVQQADTVRMLLSTQTHVVPATESASFKRELDTAQKANRNVSGPVRAKVKKHT